MNNTINLVKIMVLGAIISVSISVLTSINNASAQGNVPSLELQALVAYDELGNVVPGAAYEGMLCTAYRADPDWTCMALNDLPVFDPGLVETGVARFTENLDMTHASSAAQDIQKNSCSEPSSNSDEIIIVIRQTSAPNGYTFSEGWSIFCWTNLGLIADGTPLAGPSTADFANWYTGLGDGSTQLTASLAPGVTAQSTFDPDTGTYRIVFGGLFGATPEAKIATAPTNPDTAPTVTDTPTEPATPTGPQLADTGINTKLATLSAIAVLSAGALVLIGRKIS